MALPAEPGAGDSKFTVFIRLPFPRGDFVDPPPASAFLANPPWPSNFWLTNSRLSGTRQKIRRCGMFCPGRPRVTI